MTQGQAACEFELRTAGPAARIRLTPDTVRLAADGEDVSHLTFEITDTRGVRVPDAEQVLTFSIDGPGRIIGIGNADLNNVEDTKDLSHEAYEGRGLAIVQSIRTAGRITIRASAQGLASAQVVLEAAQPID